MVPWTGKVHDVQVSQTYLFVGAEFNDENSIVHIGCFENERDVMYMPGLVDKMRSKFRRARCTYWQTNVFDPPYEEEDFSLKQQAKNLLRELRNGLILSADDLGGIPIVFICWGMSGGILLKEVCLGDTIIFLSPSTNTYQMILLLGEHMEKNDDAYWYEWRDASEKLFYSISGVVFFGCAHDERSDNFSDRALRSLSFERGHDYYGDKIAAWKPAMDWFESRTAEFRNLSLPFLVRTYYEMTETLMYRSGQSDMNETIEISEKVRIFPTYLR